MKNSKKKKAFTLTEILISSALTLLVVGVSLSALLTVLRRNMHTQQTVVSANQIRYAFDVISKAVRTSPMEPVVSPDGRSLEIAPAEYYFATVDGTVIIDDLRKTYGIKKGSTTISFAKQMRQPAAQKLLKKDCPNTSVSKVDGEAFAALSDMPELMLEDFFSKDDIMVVGKDKVKILSIDDSTKTITLATATPLPSNVPNGTQVMATSLRKIKLEVHASGELRYYPDSESPTQYSILARDVTPAPRVDVANALSTTTLPFVYDTDTRELRVNLQQLPRGNAAGRTEMALITTLFVRTNPDSL
jgi:type II secretory pathway pseudopilin PulG